MAHTAFIDGINELVCFIPDTSDFEINLKT